MQHIGGHIPFPMAFVGVSRCEPQLAVIIGITLQVLVLTLSVCVNIGRSDDVMVLTAKNFDATVAQTEHLLVQFCECPRRLVIIRC